MMNNPRNKMLGTNMQNKENQQNAGAYNIYATEAAATAQPPMIPTGLVPCRVCNRTFLPDRIQKHEQICMKTNAKMKKRRVYNSAKHRVPTDGSSFGGGGTFDSYASDGCFGMPPPLKNKRGGGGATRGGASSSSQSRTQPGTSNTTARAPARVPQTSWREKSMAFREAIRAARRHTSSGAAPGSFNGSTNASRLQRRTPNGSRTSNSGSSARSTLSDVTAHANRINRAANAPFSAVTTSSTVTPGKKMSSVLRKPTTQNPVSSLAGRRGGTPSGPGGGSGGPSSASSQTRSSRPPGSITRRVVNTNNNVSKLPQWGGGGGGSSSGGSWGRQMSGGGGGGGFAGISNSNATSADNPFASNSLMSKPHAPVRTGNSARAAPNPMILRG